MNRQPAAQGYTVYTAAGPFSFNWDRACELYAQIKGGHGTTASDTPSRRTISIADNFTVCTQEWGNVVDGKANKVHLFGHSMGGQTIRMLAQMLAKGTKGSPTEEDAVTHPSCLLVGATAPSPSISSPTKALYWPTVA